MIEQFNSLIEEIFQMVNWVSITKYKIDMEFLDSHIQEDTDENINPTGRMVIIETDIVDEEYFIRQKIDILDLKAFIKIDRENEKDEFIRSYSFKFYDDSQKELLGFDISDKCQYIRMHGEVNSYLLMSSNEFSNWQSYIYEGYNGIEGRKIIGCKILDKERTSFFATEERLFYSQEEREAIKRMASYIRNYYRDNKYGKDDFDADQTHECCVSSYPMRELTFPSEKEDKMEEPLSDKDFIIPIEKLDEIQRAIDEFIENPPKKIRICPESDSECKYELGNENAWNHKINLKIRKRHIQQLEINNDYGEGKRFPVLDEFYTEYDTFYFSVCYDYKIGFEEKEPFGLFFAFQMRNTKPSKIHFWLDYFYQIHGQVFQHFVKKNLLDYKHILKRNKEIKKALKQWIENPREKMETDVEPSKRKVSLTINLADEYKKALLSDLKKYFEKTYWADLNLILSGNLINEKLVFDGDAASIIRVFKFCQEKKIIVNTKKDLSKWLSNNFQYKKLKEDEPSNFAESTAYQNLKKNNRKPPDSTKIELSNVKILLNSLP